RENLLEHPFHWQRGFGAFSVSDSNVPKVVRYIQNQREHHRNKSYQEEFTELLERCGLRWHPEEGPEAVREDEEDCLDIETVETVSEIMRGELHCPPC